jgi:O-antigen/teichoic acid export membrane protein
MAGTGSAQAITLISTPFLTRLYSPNDFGYLATVLGIATIIATASSLRYEAAIPIRGVSGDSEALLVLCVVLLIAVALTVLGTEALIGDSIGNGAIGYQGGFGMLAGLMMLCGLNNILTFWTIHRERFTLLSIGRISQSSGTVLAQIFLAKRFGAKGLLLGAVFGLFIYNALLAGYAISRDSKRFSFDHTVSRVREVAIAYKRFPLFGMWASLLNSFNNHLPNILFFRLLSPADAGIFSMSTRMTRAPLALVGQSVFHVMTQYAGQNAGELKEVARTMPAITYRMAHIVGPPLVVLAFFLEPVFSIVLGPDWESAGGYAQILLPWMFIIYISWPLTAIYNSFGLQRQLLGFNILFVLAVLLSFALTFVTHSAESIVISLSVLGTAARLAYCIWIYQFLLGVKFNRPIRVVSFYVIGLAGVSMVTVALPIIR